MDKEIKDDIKKFLVMEKNGMEKLIEKIKNDMESMKIIKEGMNRLLKGK
jgi:hypothetical protein